MGIPYFMMEMKGILMIFMYDQYLKVGLTMLLFWFKYATNQVLLTHIGLQVVKAGHAFPTSMWLQTSCGGNEGEIISGN